MTAIDCYAVFGHPIGHSKSPLIHRLFAEQTNQHLEYKAQDVPAEQFQTAVDQFFANGGKGLNCTVPLKELAWQYANKLTDRATRSKAVNTLVLQDDGFLLGDNTDGIGLIVDLTVNHAIDLSGTRIIVLGAGGASRGIIGNLLEQNPQSLVIANRSVEKAHQLASEFSSPVVKGCALDDLERHQPVDLLINATSASLNGQLPSLPHDLLAKGGICYDLAYGNEPTVFVRWGQQHHAAKSLDGLGMLVEQAAAAFFLWRGVRPKTHTVIEQLSSQRSEKQKF